MKFRVKDRIFWQDRRLHMTFRNVQIALRFFLIAGFSVSFSFVSRAEDLKRFDASTCNSEGGWWGWFVNTGFLQKNSSRH